MKLAELHLFHSGMATECNELQERQSLALLPAKKSKQKKGKKKKPRDGVNEREIFLCPAWMGPFTFTMRSLCREFTAPDRESTW